MKKRVKQWIFSALQILAAFMMFGLLFQIAPWMAALKRSDAIKEYHMDIPEDWDYVVMVHGTLSKWNWGTVSGNPIDFSLTCIFFTILLFFLIISSIYATRKNDNLSSRRNSSRTHSQDETV